MKQRDPSELAKRLGAANSTGLVPDVATSAPAPQEKPHRATKRRTVPMFMRLPPDLFARYDAKAVEQTKATGRGVTVQQVILEKLAEPE